MELEEQRANEGWELLQLYDLVTHGVIDNDEYNRLARAQRLKLEKTIKEIKREKKQIQLITLQTDNDGHGKGISPDMV